MLNAPEANILVIYFMPYQMPLTRNSQRNHTESMIAYLQEIAEI